MTFWKIMPSKNFLIYNTEIFFNQQNLNSLCKGDYFYVDYDNRFNQEITFFAKIISEIEPCTESQWSGWFQCRYEIIKRIVRINKFYRTIKNWTPYASDIPISSVPTDEEQDFEDFILRPYFNMTIDPTTHEPIDLDVAPPPAQVEIEPPKKIFPLNQIFYGPPGTGKTYLTRRYAVAICDNQPLENADANKFKQLCADGRVKFVTFHQSYGYEDFIEGIKPLVDERGNITYQVTAGVFKEFCDTARARRNVNFVFIIDEINRGNVSKIFGELITLIEDDKRGELSATLPYSQKEFTVPQNVYLIGTMNTADRSIALLDTALRRRFNFIEMMPRPELLSDNIDGVNLQKLLDTLNTRIETHLDREHTIGHAYFINCKTIADIAAAFRNKIIPLLQEYFFDDYALIQEVLGKKIIDAERLTDEKFRYTVNDKALLDAETYSL